jgi:hypothetical protein
MVGMAHRMRVWLVVTAGLLLVFGMGPSAGARQAQQEKQVFVTVMNLKTGSPVQGVTAAALAVKEDGKEQEILKVEPASGPMSVVLLADNTAAFIRFGKELKAAAQGFLATFMAGHAGSSAALWTFAGAPAPATKYLTDAAKLDEEAAKLKPRDAAGFTSGSDREGKDTATDREASLLYGVSEAAKELGKRTETRRVIVSFNAVTPLENSKVTKQQVAAELQKANVSWFAVTFADGGTSSPFRDNMMTEVLPYSGGFRMIVQDAAKLEPALKALADALTGQYVVTYKRASGSPKEVVVEVKGDGLRAYNPHWASK